MAKQKPVKETLAFTYAKEVNPVDVKLLKRLIEAGAVRGYVQRAGATSDGNSFSQVYLFIDDTLAEAVKS